MGSGGIVGADRQAREMRIEKILFVLIILMTFVFFD